MDIADTYMYVVHADFAHVPFVGFVRTIFKLQGTGVIPGADMHVYIYLKCSERQYCARRADPYYAPQNNQDLHPLHAYGKCLDISTSSKYSYLKCKGKRNKELLKFPKKLKVNMVGYID